MLRAATELSPWCAELKTRTEEQGGEEEAGEEDGGELLSILAINVRGHVASIQSISRRATSESEWPGALM